LRARSLGLAPTFPRAPRHRAGPRASEGTAVAAPWARLLYHDGAKIVGQEALGAGRRRPDHHRETPRGGSHGI